MARKTQARKQRMHSERSQRKAAKARARRADKPNKNSNARRSSGTMLTPFKLPVSMLAGLTAFHQLFAMQQLVGQGRSRSGVAIT